MKKSFIVMSLTVILAMLASVAVFAADFDPSKDISVISREEGSGTRGAFIELFGIEQKNDKGEKIDMTTEEAIISNSTNVVMTSVASDPYAIGYISLGSLNDTVKALKIDDAEATVKNIRDGSYKIFRPFNVAYKGKLSAVAQDFVNFIMSADGQAVVEAAGYIKVDENAAPFSSTNPSGKIVVAGSSSVTPVMEKLKEAYLKINTAAEIEIQMSDSTTGMTSAMDGICDLGMASRELKESELAVLTPLVIANDGIAVIVNNNNPIEGLTSEQVKGIFTGEITSWSELQ